MKSRDRIYAYNSSRELPGMLTLVNDVSSRPIVCTRLIFSLAQIEGLQSTEAVIAVMFRLK